MRDLKKPKVLNHLKEHGSITSLQAFDLYHATRLSSIILRLRREGYNITTLMVNEPNSGVSYAKYIFKGKGEVSA